MIRSWHLALLMVSLHLGLAVDAGAKQLEVSVGWSKPPYVIEKGNTGFEIELVRTIFEQMGHELTFIYIPFGRSYNLIKLGKVDIGMTMSNRFDITPAKLSDPYIVYQNVAISLKGRGINVNEIAELGKYSVVGFQNANIILGEQFSQAVQFSPFYTELPEQRKQVEMLLKGRADVVVMDVNIFNYLSKEFLGKSHMENVDVHKIFPKNPYRLGFMDDELRLEFNKRLQTFRETEAYRLLLRQYDFLQ
ncbi:transporter substrate-binding domain-containing protein [Thalassomonas viridans]|uniref:Transporter substrate-binding domain-containing protein n=1 Tax=Thalassomonas viridans TaxID=137584 RepID=A0AAE9YZ77_9GAMM|nr:transporter substrate-binding domain-containing protein [Thalassomonas viridans]WDE03114.1 transporter substrate-binding domain-containing protein [Thalassomonas viridans]